MGHWKDAHKIGGLWIKPPLMATATVDDGFGQGLAIIHKFAEAVGLSVHPIGLMQKPDVIIDVCRSFCPAILGLTILQFDSEETIAYIAGHLPAETILIAGGPVFAAEPDFADRAGIHVVAAHAGDFLEYLINEKIGVRPTERGMTAERPVIKDLPVMGFFFSAFLSFLFGANTIAIKISLTGLGIFSKAAIRFSLAAVTILAWALATHQPIAIRKGQIHQLVILSIIFSIQLALFYFGIRKTYASRGTLLANMQPFFVLILAHIFIPGDRITGKKLIGMLLAFTGVAFVLLQRQGVASDLKTGDIIVLCAAFLWACNGVYTKKVLVGLQPYQVVLYPMLIASPLLFAGAWLAGETIPSHLDRDVILAVMY